MFTESTTTLYFPNHIKHENSPNFSIVFIKYSTYVDNYGLATIFKKSISVFRFNVMMNRITTIKKVQYVR